jgi:hypothetical protein
MPLLAGYLPAVKNGLEKMLVRAEQLEAVGEPEDHDACMLRRS